MKTLNNWKLWLPDVLVVVIFALISFAYFFPADIEGRILYQHDASAGRGAGQEAAEYYERTGERTRWTNALFSGMPTYQTAPSYNSTAVLNQAVKAYHLWLPENVWYVFVYLLGFYILLRAFNFRQWLAALGAIVWAFSSYFFIIIAAGHIWKVMALAYLPPMIGGMVLAYRGKYLWGFIVTAIFAAFEVSANHVQMTYYYLLIILLMVVAFLVQAVREKQLARFWKATAVCAVAALIAIGMNISNLYHTWEYQKESMRGKSELVKKDADASNQTSSGLERDYITQWSYGIGETWTLLVPNAKGGSHNNQLAESREAMSKCDPQFSDFLGQWYQYWGEQPFTAGPVYVGAFVLMLFILGLFIVKGPMKWALLGATILSILLSWGKNFMPFTDFFIDYVPMYAKFRTVSSILVIAEFTIPLLAMLALKRIVDEPELLKKQAKYLYVSFGLTAGIALLFALLPTTFFSFVSQGDTDRLSQYVPQEYLASVLASLESMRIPIFTADCWRTVIVIVIGTLLLLLYRGGKLKAVPMIGCIAVLCLVDMWMVNKRYLNDKMFVSKSVREQPQEMTAADKKILEDKTLNYRVMNLTDPQGPFNENNTSFYHKSIGGYHAAKLRRYQELIDAHIAPELQGLSKAQFVPGEMVTVADNDSIFPVLNMLNARYLIVPLQGGATPVLNQSAFGNGWFVNKVTYVANANEELDGVGTTDLRHEAVADARFKDVLGESQPQDSTAQVTLTAYEPNQLTYKLSSATGGVVVFSEIYYPGWTATIDGQEAELGRVNYVLRALKVPAGEHEVVLNFFPKTVKETETIAYIALCLLLLGFAYAIWSAVRTTKKTEE